MDSWGRSRVDPIAPSKCATIQELGKNYGTKKIKRLQLQLKGRDSRLLVAGFFDLEKWDQMGPTSGGVRTKPGSCIPGSRDGHGRLRYRQGLAFADFQHMRLSGLRYLVPRREGLQPVRLPGAPPLCQVPETHVFSQCILDFTSCPFLRKALSAPCLLPTLSSALAEKSNLFASKISGRYWPKFLKFLRWRPKISCDDCFFPFFSSFSHMPCRNINDDPSQPPLPRIPQLTSSLFQAKKESRMSQGHVSFVDVSQSKTS